MRKLKALAIGLAVVGLAVLPGVAASFELGNALSRLEASEASAEKAKGVPETIATYEVNPDTMEASIRLHRVHVVR